MRDQATKLLAISLVADLAIGRDMRDPIATDVIPNPVSRSRGRVDGKVIVAATIHTP